jgi:hypothetical protein
MLGEQLRGAWKRSTLSETQQQAQRNERSKSGCNAGQGRGDRPDRQSNRQGPIGIDAFRQPARQNLRGHIAPEKGRQKHADLGA